MTSVRWDGESDSNKRDTLQFARDASDLLYRDARRSASRSIESNAQQLANAIRMANTNTPQLYVEQWAQTFADTYRQLMNISAVHACPPLSVIVPAVTDDGMGEPTDGDPDDLERVAGMAEQQLPASDTLRGAVRRWADWWAGITLATSDERMRAHYLAAWASDAVQHAVNERPAPPPPTGTPSQRQGTMLSPFGGGGFGPLLVLAVLAMASKGRRR